MAVAGLLCAGWFLQVRSVPSDGTALTVEVLRFGMMPAIPAAGGDRPILTVRMPDGSTRDVLATWADVDDCRPGRLISLVQHGTALRIGKPGCQAPNGRSR